MPAETETDTTTIHSPDHRRREIRSVLYGFVLGALLWSALVRVGLAQLVSPADHDLTLWAALACALIARTRGRKLIEGLAAGTVLLLFLIGFTPILRGPAHRLVLREAPEKADAVVVLSSSVNDEGNLDRQGFDRLVGGMELLRDGYAPVLVRTWMPSPLPSPEADVRKSLHLLPRPVRVEEVGPVASTRDEALAVKALYDRKGWRRVLLVTSPLHSARAAATFRRAGMRVISVPCTDRDYAITKLRHPEERFRVFRMFARERLAWALYRMRGWV